MKIKIETTQKHIFYADVDWENVMGELIEVNRGMGEEYVHSCDVDIECPICHKKIAKVDVYEYPEGTFNFAEGFYESHN